MKKPLHLAKFPANRETAKIILENPAKYPGLMHEWAVAILSKTSAGVGVDGDTPIPVDSIYGKSATEYSVANSRVRTGTPAPTSTERERNKGRGMDRQQSGGFLAARRAGDSTDKPADSICDSGPEVPDNAKRGEDAVAVSPQSTFGDWMREWFDEDGNPREVKA